MIEFENIDTFKRYPQAQYLVVTQRYLYREEADLRSERPNLAQTFESNFTPTTLPALPHVKIEELYQTQQQLIEKRTKLLDSILLFLRPGKKRELEVIDKQLDQIEYQIIALQRDDRERTATAIENLINDNEELIQKYNSRRNIVG